MEILRRAWRGEERLWKVWWLIGIPQSVLLVLLYVKFLAGKTPSTVYLAALVLYPVIYFAWVRMAWLCSPNVKHGIWAAASYVMIVFGVLNLARTLVLS